MTKSCGNRDSDYICKVSGKKCEKPNEKCPNYIEANEEDDDEMD